MKGRATMPSTELSGALATRRPASCEVTISFEYDDPSADAALVDAQKYRLAGIADQRVAWIEESVQSEDQGVPGDQHHDVRATFDVPHADEQRAARMACPADAHCRAGRRHPWRLRQRPLAARRRLDLNTHINDDGPLSPEWAVITLAHPGLPPCSALARVGRLVFGPTPQPQLHRLPFAPLPIWRVSALYDPHEVATSGGA